MSAVDILIPKCPFCQTEGAFEGNNKLAHPGTITVCAMCAHILVFDQRMQLAPLLLTRDADPQIIVGVLKALHDVVERRMLTAFGVKS